MDKVNEQPKNDFFKNSPKMTLAKHYIGNMAATVLVLPMDKTIKYCTNYILLTASHLTGVCLFVCASVVSVFSCA